MTFDLHAWSLTVLPDDRQHKLIAVSVSVWRCAKHIPQFVTNPLDGRVDVTDRHDAVLVWQQLLQDKQRQRWTVWTRTDHNVTQPIHLQTNYTIHRFIAATSYFQTGRIKSLPLTNFVVDTCMLTTIHTNHTDVYWNKLQTHVTAIFKL